MFESESFSVSGPAELEFDVFEAVNDMVVKACVNSPNNCPWTSQKRVTPSDLKWQKGKIPLQQGDSKVIFIAENTGRQLALQALTIFNCFLMPAGVSAVNMIS